MRPIVVLVLSLFTFSDGSSISDGSNISDGSSISDRHQESDSVQAEVLSRLEHLEAENKELKMRLAETEDNFQKQIELLAAKVDLCEGRDDMNLNSAYKSGDQELDSLNLSNKGSKRRQRRERNRGVRQVESSGIAFTAYLDHIEDSLVSHQTIIYNQALLNDGNAYSNNTGIFRAPVPGVYLFSWSVMARRMTGKGGYDVRVDLLHNGVQVLTAVAESFVEHEDNQGSNTAVLRLAQGDEVWTTHNSRNFETYGSVNDRETSFMGVLLYEEESTTAIVG